MNLKTTLIKTVLAGCACILLLPAAGAARDIEYKSTEVDLYVAPGEPTQVEFPGKISGGFKKKQSSLSLDRKESDLIVFASDAITRNGEAIIVRLDNGKSYSLRIRRASDENPRDAQVAILDSGSIISDDSDDVAPYKQADGTRAPSSTPAGLLREMVLVAEFGKSGVTGYQISDRYRGESVLNDGAISATIDRVFIGPTLWGYVLDAKNMLNETQKLNPAAFRLDGTRAISAERWELAPQPLTVEQQVADAHSSKVYVITRARGK